MTCAKCHRTDPPCGFYTSTASRQCKDCHRASALARYHLRMAEPGFREAERRRRREYTRTHSRQRYRKRIRLLNDDQHAAQITVQGGGCAICRTPVDISAPVDHDHVTGAVRGVLCTDCNLLLGRAHDDVTVLANAITYLNNPPYQPVP